MVLIKINIRNSLLIEIQSDLLGFVVQKQVLSTYRKSSSWPICINRHHDTIIQVAVIPDEFILPELRDYIQTHVIAISSSADTRDLVGFVVQKQVLSTYRKSPLPHIFSKICIFVLCFLTIINVHFYADYAATCRPLSLVY